MRHAVSRLSSIRCCRFSPAKPPSRHYKVSRSFIQYEARPRLAATISFLRPLIAVRKMGDLSKVEYRQLGKSGLRVSVPILGAMSIGDSRWQKWVLDEEEVRADFAASNGASS